MTNDHSDELTAALADPPRLTPVFLENDFGPFGAWMDAERRGEWAFPRFERTEADRLMTAINQYCDEHPMFYDPERDAFVQDDPSGANQDVWKGEDFQGRRVYPIGAGAWAWR